MYLTDTKIAQSLIFQEILGCQGRWLQHTKNEWMLNPQVSLSIVSIEDNGTLESEKKFKSWFTALNYYNDYLQDTTNFYINRTSTLGRKWPCARSLEYKDEQEKNPNELPFW